MGRLFLIDPDGIFYSCKHCNTPLALANELVSVQGRHERMTYLFNNVVNVTFREREGWELNRGLRATIVDIFCVKCGSDVGWESVRMDHRVRKFVLKRQLIDMIAWWTATYATATVTNA